MRGHAAELGNGHSTGTVDGIESEASDKGWNVTVALGSMAFAYSYSYILLEMTVCADLPCSAAGLSRGACLFGHLGKGTRCRRVISFGGDVTGQDWAAAGVPSERGMGRDRVGGNERAWACARRTL